MVTLQTVVLDLQDTGPDKIETAFLPWHRGVASVQRFRLMCCRVPGSHLFRVYSVAASGQDMALQAIMIRPSMRQGRITRCGGRMAEA